MKYLIKAKLKPNRKKALLAAIEAETLGEGSVAGGEYLRAMRMARLLDDGTVCWTEVCYCKEPLAEERPYWEAYFELVEIQDAHARKNCLDDNGTEKWACGTCDCTEALEKKMATWGQAFLGSMA